jgi:16S rRNA processing protein RimM
MGEEKRVCIGAIAGAHGVKGVVRVKPFTERAEDVAAYAPVTDESGSRIFALRYVGPAKGAVLVRIEGIDDRDAAEALKGVRLYVPRSSLPAPDDEEFYHADLIGLAVVDADGAAIGRVRAVEDYGAGDLLEVELTGGRVVMLPFTKAVVPEIDLAAGRLVAVPPAGLLDGPERESEV